MQRKELNQDRAVVVTEAAAVTVTEAAAEETAAARPV